MNLRVTRVGEVRPALVAPPGGGHVAALGIGGQVIDVPVPAGAQHNGVADVAFQLPGHQIAGDDAAGLAVDDHQVEHFPAGKHFHLAQRDLPHLGLIRPQQQLLASLPLAVECPRDLRPAE
jgi:hypothetical protein